MKATFVRILVYLWALALTVYLVMDRWEHFRETALAERFKAGRAEVIAQVIAKAQTCKPFTVSNDQGTTTLVQATCPQVRLVPSPGPGAGPRPGPSLGPPPSLGGPAPAPVAPAPAPSPTPPAPTTP